MTAMQVNDLASKYAEERFNKPLDPNHYSNAAAWFKTNAKDGTEEDYLVFIDIVHMWTKNKYELVLSDAYCHYPDFNG